MKHIFSSFLLVIGVLLCSCQNNNDDNYTLTIKGVAIVAPSSRPIPNATVSIQNNQSTLVATRTSNEGEFILSFDVADIDDSYYLSIYISDLHITKTFKIKGFGQAEYNYGQLVVFQEYSISGTVISTPNDLPMPNIKVSVSDSTHIITSTTTSAIGFFELVVQTPQLKDDFIISLLDETNSVTKTIKLPTFNGYECQLGNIILYDRRNPYNLPSFQYGGYTYVVHSVLRDKMKYFDALNACESLSDFGITDWFLPNNDEFDQITNNILSLNLDMPLGNYWTYHTNNQGTYKGIDYAYGRYYIYQHGTSTTSLLYVVPVFRY